MAQVREIWMFLKMRSLENILLFQQRQCLSMLKRENTHIGCYNCRQNEKEEAHGAWEGITGKEPAQMNLRRLPGREAPVQPGLGNRRKFNDKNHVQQIQAKKSIIWVFLEFLRDRKK